jgi:hypothetical protein
MRTIRNPRGGAPAATTARHNARGGGMRRGGQLKIVGVIGGLIASGAFVWQGSQAAFTSTTASGTNTFSSGTVTLSSTRNGSVLFNPTGIKPGDSGVQCVDVKYDGTLLGASITNVKFYGTGYTTNALGQAMTLGVEQGTGTCPNPTGPTFIYPALSSFDTFGTTKTTFASGIDTTWKPASTNDTRYFRITWTLPSAATTGAGLTANIAFTWEVQSA